MKTRILPGWVLGMALASGALTPGLTQNAINPSPTVASPEKAGAAVLSPPVVTPAVPAPSAETASNSLPATPAVSRAPVTSQSTAIVSLSPWFYEVERLARAGVDDSVLLAYINNTAGTFNLTADQVIYLKNLGLSTQVINTMMDHDQELISGARPMPASAPPPFPPAVQAALAARLHPAGNAPTPSAAPAAPSPAPESTIIAPDDDSDAAGTLVSVEPDDVPDQPRSAGPVRVPYPVKLNDPIIILKLPSFGVPYW
ncbi:MAG: hypothetical protein ACLQU3_07315 [Limisphaerales bacterium]